MKYSYSLLILLCVTILQSCCFKKGEEIAKISFTTQEKALIPYQDAELVDFITNDGFEFQLLAKENIWFSTDQDECEDYTTYENYRVDFSSEIPNLNIELQLIRDVFNDVQNSTTSVRIVVNRIFLSYDNQPLETLEIDNVIYENIYRYETTEENSPITAILFNNTNGIIKIEYANQTYAQIN